MEIAVGIILALVVAGFARRTGLDRDRAFYSTVVIIVASYYVLFAAIGGSIPVLAGESIVMLAFVLAAVLGFRLYPWLLVVGLAGHGVFDLMHDLVVKNPGMPEWWPAFCSAFDIAAAIALAWRTAAIREPEAGAAGSSATSDQCPRSTSLAM